ncbi:MAG TPA: hypothetical protein VGJ16_14615, partial [Pirellulales bacterium]
MSSSQQETPKRTRGKFLIKVLAAVVAITALGGALYAAFLPGLSTAHQEPPAAEVIVATWLLHQSVPDD